MNSYAWVWTCPTCLAEGIRPQPGDEAWAAAVAPVPRCSHCGLRSHDWRAGLSQLAVVHVDGDAAALEHGTRVRIVRIVIPELA